MTPNNLNLPWSYLREKQTSGKFALFFDSIVDCRGKIIARWSGEGDVLPKAIVEAVNAYHAKTEPNP